MKSTVKGNNVLKTIAITASAVVLFAGSPLLSSAHTMKAANEKTNKIPEYQIDVQYVGSDDNKFQFKIDFENTSAQPFTLTIKNDEGVVVYSKEFNDAHFEKTISIVKDEISAEGIHPTFAISVGNRLIQRSFSIEKKTVQNVVVTKL